jgi:hypothetical protein
MVNTDSERIDRMYQQKLDTYTKAYESEFGLKCNITEPKSAIRSILHGVLNWFEPPIPISSVSPIERLNHSFARLDGYLIKSLARLETEEEFKQSK